MDKNIQDISVLHVNTNDSYGGAARFALNMHTLCCRELRSSWFAVGCKNGNFVNTIQVPNGDYGSFINRKIILPFKRRICLKMGIDNFNYPASNKLLDIIPERPDIIHCNNLHGDYFDLRVLPYLSNLIPTVVTLHDPWLLSGSCVHSGECRKWQEGCGGCAYLKVHSRSVFDFTAYNWRRKRDIYLKSKLYVATPCRWLMQKVEESILMPAIIEKRVIPNGVDLNIFYPAAKEDLRRELNLPLDAHVLLFAGNCLTTSPWRDYNMLEKALVKIAGGSHPKSIVMLCVGAEEEATVRISQDVEIRKIKFKHNQEDMVKMYQASDLFVFPSKSDTFPMSILEAMACGIPVVATAVGGIPEQVQDAKTGFLVEAGDADAMAKKILELLNNFSMLETFGRNSYELVKECFDLQKQGAIYLSWFRQILGVH
jgi:glycosyltransferase involved in cell wall biosynthesis